MNNPTVSLVHAKLIAANIIAQRIRWGDKKHEESPRRRVAKPSEFGSRRGDGRQRGEAGRLECGGRY